MMKHPKTASTAKAGVLFLQDIVNRQGSVFRPVHQEDDLGIDGFIEPVSKEEASGRLIAVQVKSGDSYLSSHGDEFVIPVDERHLSYWTKFVVPVVIVAHSPKRRLAAYVSVRDYVEQEEYHDRLPVKSIRIPTERRLNKAAVSRLAELARARADERILIRAADQCLSHSAAERKSGFLILANHPDSRDLRVTCLMARRLLLSSDEEIAKDALYTLGYGVGRRRWSWNPNNQVEKEQSLFARELCESLSDLEVRRGLELCDQEGFHGPDALGERLFDILNCCFERASRVLDAIARERSFPMVRRQHAAYLLCQCDDEVCDRRRSAMERDPDLADLAAVMFSQIPVVEAGRS